MIVKFSYLHDYPSTAANNSDRSANSWITASIIFLFLAVIRKSYVEARVNARAISDSGLDRGGWPVRKHWSFCTQLGHCPSFILRAGERASSKSEERVACRVSLLPGQHFDRWPYSGLSVTFQNALCRNTPNSRSPDPRVPLPINEILT